MGRFSLVGALVAALLILGLARAQTVPVAVAVDLDRNSTTGMQIEGLVADQNGRLYTTDTLNNRFFRIDPATQTVEQLGTLPRRTTGMAFDQAGNLYLASTDQILRLTAQTLAANPFDPAGIQVVAAGVPNANGLAFGPNGNLYVSGGDTGKIYVLETSGVTRTLVSGLASESQQQRISTNGLAFGPDGKLYSANTGTGSIDRITLNPDGTAAGVEQFSKDPLLLGADGIAFASNGDLYVCANERNAIIKVDPAGKVSEVASNTNAGPLEFPASPVFVGSSLFVSNFDVERGTNSPNAPGVGASIARLDVGIQGAPLAAQPTTTGTPATTTTGTAVATTTAAVTTLPLTTVPITTTATPFGTPDPLAPTVAPITTTVDPAYPPPDVTPIIGGAPFDGTVTAIPDQLPNTGEADDWSHWVLAVAFVALALGWLTLRDWRSEQ